MEDNIYLDDSIYCVGLNKITESNIQKINSLQGMNFLKDGQLTLSSFPYAKIL